MEKNGAVLRRPGIPTPQSVGFYQDTLLAYFNFNPIIAGDTLPQILFYDGDYINEPDAICSTPGLGKEETSFSQNTFSLYPNPNRGRFRIESSSGANLTIIDVYNTQGQLVWSQEYEDAPNKVEIKLDHLTAGLYIVKVNNSHAQQILIH